MSILPTHCRIHKCITPIEVCRRFSRGNTFVQFGQVLFDDDIQAIKDANRIYEF